MRKTLLVIDMLNDFMDPQGALYCGDGALPIIPVIRRLMDSFHAERQPILFARDAHSENDKEFQLFKPHAQRGSWGAEILPALTPPPGSHVFDKTRFSAFYGTVLDRLLADTAPEEVWVAGVVTSICVMDTVGDLRNRDYTPVVPVDAVADFDPQAHAFALKRMERVYGARMVRMR
ncbi:MAG: cysteine hydrolase family protein [Syntrophobacteraceae bacterium]